MTEPETSAETSVTLGTEISASAELSASTEIEISADPQAPAQAEHVSTSTFRRLVAIVAPPRSGTTIVTAALSVHSEIVPVYEPWNDSKDVLDATLPMDFAAFRERFVPADRSGSVLLVKETGAEPAYLQRVEELMETAPADVERQLILILRNPFHVYLSEVQARREWWGVDDLEIDADSFSVWAERMLESCRVLANMAISRESLLLCYDSFTRDPDAVATLTKAIGLDVEPSQAEFDRHLDRSAIRGDLRVSSDPAPISAVSVDRRERELADVIGRSPDPHSSKRSNAWRAVSARCPASHARDCTVRRWQQCGWIKHLSGAPHDMDRAACTRAANSICCLG